MRSTYYKSAIIAASTSYLSTPATSIDISAYDQDQMLDIELEDSEADINMTLAQDWRDEMLAQTEVQGTKHHCTFAVDRLRGGPDKDFYNIQEGDNKKGKYRHQEFQGLSTIRWNDNPHVGPDDPWEAKYKYQWENFKTMRVNLLKREAKKAGKQLSLFGTNGVSPNDVDQGQLGNCWVMTAAAAMAEVPGRVENIFINHEENATRGINRAGIYALNLYALMMPIQVTIDDRLPNFEFLPDQRMYARIGEDGSVWAPLLEKAMAYYHGTYEALHAGNPGTALNTLAGAPGKGYWHNMQITKDDLWDVLIELPDYDMIQSGTDVSRNGIVGGHAYTILKPIQVGDGPKLMEVRNPWGEFEWTGDYSDNSDLWTDDLKEAYGFTEVRDDGVFFMPYDDYWTHMSWTWVNHDTSDMYRDDWLILDDNTDSPGSEWYCGQTCTRHEFTLKSSVDQKVLVSANTWQRRSYPVACDPTSDLWHIVKVEGQDKGFWKFGTHMLKPFEMTAGQELQMHIEMDFEDRDMARDASVVVWGFDGPVELVHNGGIPASSFETLPPDNDN